METQLHQILAPLSQNEFIAVLGGALNRLGKGDALAFIGILLVLHGFVRGEGTALRAGLVSFFVLTLSGLCVQTLKHLLGRARPGENLGDFHLIGPNFFKAGFDSFPSGHAFSSFAFASFMAAYYPQWRWVCYGTAAAISILGRVVFRHHFLSDVIVGAVLGILLGAWASKKFRPWIEKS